MSELNYSNYLEAIVNGFIVPWPFENQKMSISTEIPTVIVESNEIVVEPDLSDKPKYVEKFTQSDVNGEISKENILKNGEHNPTKRNEYNKIKIDIGEISVSIFSLSAKSCRGVQKPSVLM